MPKHVYSNALNLNEVTSSQDPIPRPSLKAYKQQNSIFLTCSLSCAYETVHWNRGNSTLDDLRNIHEDDHNFQSRLTNESYYNQPCRRGVKAYTLSIDITDLDLNSVLPNISCIGERNGSRDIYSNLIQLQKEMSAETDPVTDSTTIDTARSTSTMNTSQTSKVIVYIF